MTESKNLTKPSESRRKPARTRAEIERDASKQHRENKKAAGQVNLRTFVSPTTRDELQKMKDEMGVATVGDVIENLVKQFRAANK
jgi:hypothetical protein